MNEVYEQQLKIFLENDPHAKEVLTLFDAYSLLCTKLAPILSTNSKSLLEAAAISLAEDVAKELNVHIKDLAKRHQN